MVNYIIGPLIIYNNPNVEMRTILERSLRKKTLPQKYFCSTRNHGENTECGA